ncbi:MAG TPA: universal stress protein [Actinomycetota bacterium]
MYKKILVGTDGSGTAASAVAHAAALAEAAGAELIVVSAYATPKETPSALAPADAPSGIDVAVGVLDDVDRRYASRVKLTTVAREAAPSDALIEVAEEQGAGVIVVGNRGMQGAKRYVIGSVPNTVSHHAPCDVLIVHTTDEG